MKKRKLLKGTAIGAAVAGLALGGCAQIQDVYGPPPDSTDPYDPGTMIVEDVYGPPEYFSQEEVTEFETTDELNEAVYGPPAEETFDPADEINEDVYGPPEVFD